MDLGTVRKRLDSGRYTWQRPHKLHDDICLVFQNALRFAKPGQMIYKLAKEMLDNFEDEYEQKLHNLYHLEAATRQQKASPTNFLVAALGCDV